MKPVHRRAIPISQWPKGLCFDLARISMDVETLAQKLDVPVESGDDDLDYFRAVIIDAEFGPIAFQQYRGMPDRSTLIICMEGQADPSTLLDNIATAFSIPAGQFVWTCFWAQD